MCACARAPLSNLSRIDERICARNSLYSALVYTVQERYIVVQCILVISADKMSTSTVGMLKSNFCRQRTGNKRPPTIISS